MKIKYQTLFLATFLSLLSCTSHDNESYIVSRVASSFLEAFYTCDFAKATAFCTSSGVKDVCWFASNLTEDELALMNDRPKIEIGETTDRINILYSSISADNLMKANKLFGENITTVSQASSSPDGNSTNSTNSTITYKKSSSGLSTGGIIGVTIPCCAVLAAITGVAFATRGNAAATNAGTDNANSTVVNLQVPVQNANIIPNPAENVVQVPVTNPV